MPELHHLGRIAYAAYARAALALTTDDAVRVSWMALPEVMKDGWQAAGVAARNDGYGLRCGDVLHGDEGEEYVCGLDPAHIVSESDHCDAMGLAQWPVSK